MSDPIITGLILAGTMASTGITAYTQYQQSKYTRARGKHEEALSKVKSTILTDKAKYDLSLSERKQATILKRGKLVRGSVRATAAGHGVAAESESLVSLERYLAGISYQDAMTQAHDDNLKYKNTLWDAAYTKVQGTNQRVLREHQARGKEAEMLATLSTGVMDVGFKWGAFNKRGVTKPFFGIV